MRGEMFSENYSVCLNDDGSAREIQRNGPAVTYKAIGYDSGRAVAMQLIPLANIDEVDRVRFEESARATQRLDNTNLARVLDVGVKDDHLVSVTEYLEGETAEAWIRAHGPMAADAVLRIGHQVMNALGAAATHGLTHRSIQPANLMILPGVADDGGWPRVKLLNFGLGGLKVHSDESETHEVFPSLPPEFSSPEQRENKPVDFRSDIFSLGATMWFLLTGSAPSALPTTESGPRLSAPTGAVPRFVRNLVSRMLRTNPEERPQDPAAFAEKIHACLQKAERQTAFTRSFAPAAIPTTIPIREKKRIAPALALAAAIVVLASFGAFYLVRPQREAKPLGVIIGVPETAEGSSLPVTASPSASPVVNQVAEHPRLVAQQSPKQAVSPGPMAENVSSSPQAPQLAANNRMAEPPVPAAGPSETKQAPVRSESPPAEKNQSAPLDLPNRTELAPKDSLATTAAGDEPPNFSGHVATAKKPNDSNASKTRARRQRVAKSSAHGPLPPLRVGSAPARFVGTTPSGNWVLQLPSGETIITPPLPNVDDAPVLSHRRVRRVARPIPLEDEPPVVVLPPDF